MSGRSPLRESIPLNPNIEERLVNLERKLAARDLQLEIVEKTLTARLKEEVDARRILEKTLSSRIQEQDESRRKSDSEVQLHIKQQEMYLRMHVDEQVRLIRDDVTTQTDLARQNATEALSRVSGVMDGSNSQRSNGPQSSRPSLSPASPFFLPDSSHGIPPSTILLMESKISQLQSAHKSLQNSMEDLHASIKAQRQQFTKEFTSMFGELVDREEEKSKLIIDVGTHSQKLAERVNALQADVNLRITECERKREISLARVEEVLESQRGNLIQISNAVQQLSENSDERSNEFNSRLTAHDSAIALLEKETALNTSNLSVEKKSFADFSEKMDAHLAEQETFKAKLRSLLDNYNQRLKNNAQGLVDTGSIVSKLEESVKSIERSTERQMHEMKVHSNELDDKFREKSEHVQEQIRSELQNGLSAVETFMRDLMEDVRTNELKKVEDMYAEVHKRDEQISSMRQGVETIISKCTDLQAIVYTNEKKTEAKVQQLQDAIQNMFTPGSISSGAKMFVERVDTNLTCLMKACDAIASDLKAEDRRVGEIQDRVKNLEQEVWYSSTNTADDPLDAAVSDTLRSLQLPYRVLMPRVGNGVYMIEKDKKVNCFFNGGEVWVKVGGGNRPLAQVMREKVAREAPHMIIGSAITGTVPSSSSASSRSAAAAAMSPSLSSSASSSFSSSFGSSSSSSSNAIQDAVSASLSSSASAISSRLQDMRFDSMLVPLLSANASASSPLSPRSSPFSAASSPDDKNSILLESPLESGGDAPSSPSSVQRTPILQRQQPQGVISPASSAAASPRLGPASSPQLQPLSSSSVSPSALRAAAPVKSIDLRSQRR